MEPVRDPYLQYKDLLLQAFDKVKKTVPKKYKELKDICQDASDKVALEKDGPYDANKYFYILKMALDTKITKLMEHTLYIIQKLISYEFLDGNCEDNCLYQEDQQPNPMNGRLHRKLIDAIVESICNCVPERDNQVQLQIIKVLLTIVTTFNSKVHEKSLLEAFRAIYQIHITSTNQINQNTAKASLTQMMNIVFSKMEAYSGNFGIELKKLQSRTSNHSNDSSTISDKNLKDTNLIIKKQTTKLSEGEETKLDETSQSLGGTLSVIQHQNLQKESSENVLVNFNALDQYLFTVVQNMVDDVCLHQGKVEEVKAKYETQIAQLEHGTEGEEKDMLESVMKKEVENIPLRSVPIRLKKEEQKYKNQQTVKISNELGIEAGKFGWCIVCRNKANLYCRDTRHPVCSFECKQRHMNLIDSIQAPSIDGLPNFYNSEEARRYFTDAVVVFRSICKLSLKELPNQNVNTFTMRSKVLGLELILAVVEKPGTTFVNRREFIDIIKDTLCDGLIKYCVSNEKTIFSLSLSIFYGLFLHFREHLKQEIIVFIEQIFLKILDSGNSNYHHKYLILNVFDKLSQNTKHMLELFVNYDCDAQSKDIFGRMIDTLSKIAQGKFAKSEHQTIIAPQEEYSLRMYALQILVQLLRNVNKTIEVESMEFKIAQKEVSQHSGKRESSVDNNSDDEDISTNLQTNSETTQQFIQGATMIQQNNSTNIVAGSAIAQNLAKYEVSRAHKNEMVKAAIKFNLKQKNGIAYLQQKGFVAKSTDEQQFIIDMTNFFKTVPSLDKTKIGDYLGDEHDLPKRVMYLYIDQINFIGRHIVDALKLLLDGFRLPGEGQKVDRIMEKFGEKYTRDNPDSSYGNAETVYMLSYAIIMLQTTLHNPQAKTTMTIDDFKKITKGINAGKDLDPDVILHIYETIKNEPITLAEDDNARLKLEAQGANSYKKKQEIFLKEGENFVKQSAKEIKQKRGVGGGSSQFILVNDTEPIKTMFENVWSANLAVFSVLLEETDDKQIWSLALEGFMHSIKISGYYNMETERNAFVNSLSKFTQVATIKEIKEKNLECIKELINLATYDGNYLRNSWYYVLDCISKIDQMHVMGSGLKTDSAFFNQNKKKNQQIKRTDREAVMQANSELIVQKIDPTKIDLIIQRSVNLDADAIIDFIQALCHVSKEELSDLDNPRKFSLQRLVEVADFNMGRIRIVWGKIWALLSDHFITVGSHSNLHVAIYAIDSLRQLADKFLLKEEFGQYTFQKDFLKPFETIMLNNLHTRVEIKEYIITCTTAMCQTKTKYIKSGWIILINIFTLSAQDTEESLVKQSFNALKFAIMNQFQLLADNFVELVNCLNKFSKNNFIPQALESLNLLETCSDELSKKEILDKFTRIHGNHFYQRELDTANRLSYYVSKYKKHDDELRKQISQKGTGFMDQASEDKSEELDALRIRHSVQKGLWFPILTNLTNLIMEKRKDLQERSFQLLFKILSKNCNHFTDIFWQDILFQIMLPLLEDIHLAVEIPSKNNDTEFYRITTQEFLTKLTEFFATNITRMSSLIPCYLEVLSVFIAKINEKIIVQTAINSLKQFISAIGTIISKQSWDIIVQQICELFDTTLPRVLLEEKDKYNQEFAQSQQLKETTPQGKSPLSDSQKEDRAQLNDSQDACFTKCIVQLLLIQTTSETIDKFCDQLSLHNLEMFLKALDQSYRFAQEFNQELGLRYKLWKDGFMADLKQLPGLIKQERDSLSTYLNIMFRLYFTPKEGQNIGQQSKKLFDLCQKVIKEYSLKQSELTALNNSKQEENNNGLADVEDDEDQDGANGDKEPSLSYLHENELERQLHNLTPIVATIILPNLNKLSNVDLKNNTKELGPLLIELTLCNNYEIRANNKELLNRVFEYLIQKVELH